VREAVERLATIMDSGAWQKAEYQERTAVT
jgi:hypothetical protein